MQSMTKTLAACCLILFSFAAHAEDNRDVVVGPGKAPVRSIKFGNCVRTKWMAPDDVCAPAPAPKAVQVIQPAPPAPQAAIKLEREQLTIYFDFNKAILTEGGKHKLDQVANAVNSSPKVTRVNIVGYTDQIGSDSYNKKLSVKRAQAVKAYIDKEMRIPANVVGLRGLGKSNPVVECKSVKQRQAKIKCLARNRRVELEFDYHQ